MPAADPLLIDLPEQIVTDRLILRAPRPGDGRIVNDAVVETIDDLQPWMPWARPTPTVEQMESWCRKAHAEFAGRQQLPLLLFHRTTGEFVGSSGMHAIEWSVPRVEIGYWVRRRCTGQGYISEAVDAIARFAFATLKAERVEIRTDPGNARSRRVAERLGFVLEGTLRRDSRTPSGALRDSCVYAKVRTNA